MTSASASASDDAYLKLGMAAGNGDAAGVIQALENGKGRVTANECYPGPGFNNQQIPVLHIACYSRDVPTIEALLMRGADVNALDGNKSALHNACEQGDLDVVTVLLEAGCAVMQDAVAAAEAKGYTEIVELLRTKIEQG